MKEYGIKTHHYDGVPGFRDSWDTEEWFDNQQKRDEKLSELENKIPSQDPDDILIEIEQSQKGEYYDQQNYYKIEREVND